MPLTERNIGKCVREKEGKYAKETVREMEEIPEECHVTEATGRCNGKKVRGQLLPGLLGSQVRWSLSYLGFEV